MELSRRSVAKLVIIGAAVLAIAAPAVVAQTPGVVEKLPAVVDANGNTVVTEQTRVGGQLVKEEITVTSPGGQLVSKTETTFDPATGTAKQEIVTVANGIATQVEKTFANVGGITPGGGLVGANGGAPELIKNEQKIKAEEQHGVEAEHGTEQEHSGGGGGHP